jgi:hypothetical protein
MRRDACDALDIAILWKERLAYLVESCSALQEGTFRGVEVAARLGPENELFRPHSAWLKILAHTSPLDAVPSPHQLLRSYISSTNLILDKSECS